MDTVLELVVGFCLVLFILLCGWTLAAIPFSFYVDMKCAEAGFPASKVTVNFEAYCYTLTGQVQSPAVPLSQVKK